MRIAPIITGQYYHVYNRGAFKQNLYRDNRDYIRFLFCIVYTQSPLLFRNMSRMARTYSATDGFVVPPETIQDIITGRFVELVAFCLMPNHFHLIVKEITENGMARYMQRVGDGYTKYFNTKYESSGRIFQGIYQARHIADENYLTYLSAYIHRNPREQRAWKNKEFEYPWSSLQDYTEANRWGGLLVPDIVADRFGATHDSNYKDFVKTSGAKILEEELDDLF